MSTGLHSASIGAFQISGGTVNGTGTFTSNVAYDVQAGTVNVGLGGNVGLNKTGPGTVSLTKSLPGGNYTISNGTLNTNGLSQSISSFQITGGTLSGSGMPTSSAAYDVQAGTVNANFGGVSIALNKTGSGTAVLNGANTYTGLTAVTGGRSSWDRRRRTRCSILAAPTFRRERWSSIIQGPAIRRRRSRACWPAVATMGFGTSVISRIRRWGLPD